jgi:hypothetical protein
MSEQLCTVDSVPLPDLMIAITCPSQHVCDRGHVYWHSTAIILRRAVDLVDMDREPAAQERAPGGGAKLVCVVPSG